MDIEELLIDTHKPPSTINLLLGEDVGDDGDNEEEEDEDDDI